MRSLVLNLSLLTAQNWVPGPLTGLGGSRLAEGSECAPAPATPARCQKGLLSPLTVFTSLLSASQFPCSKDLFLSPSTSIKTRLASIPRLGEKCLPPPALFSCGDRGLVSQALMAFCKSASGDVSEMGPCNLKESLSAHAPGPRVFCLTSEFGT